MNTPFTVEQFIEVFREYNLAVWPMQVIIWLLAIGIISLAIIKTSYSDRAINATLTFLWLWMGVVYHLRYFSPINKAAYLFGLIFVIHAFVFLYFGVFHSKLTYRFRSSLYGLTGSIIILYALLIYPLIGMFSGHSYPDSPTFGLPCPTTIFTLGLLLWTDKKFPSAILIIPFIWSIIGMMAAVNFGIKEDFGLLISSIIAISLILYRNRRNLNTPAQ